VTPAQARTISNVVLASAGVAAAYVIFTTPPLRRAVLAAATRWLGTDPTAYLIGQVRGAWAASRHRPHN
jgi:hypothetical protein